MPPLGSDSSSPPSCPATSSSAASSASTSPFALAGVRLNTPRSCFASRRRRAIAWPMRPAPMNPTFMVFPSGCELTANPFELARDVVDDVAALQVLGQHVPGVGLDLELARQRLRLVEPERVLYGEARRAPLSQAVEEDRNVAPGGPLRGGG